LEDTLTPRVFRARGPVYIANAAEDQDAPLSMREVAQRASNYSALVAPMMWDGRGIGSISITRAPNAVFSAKEVALLKTFADQAVIAIQNAKMFRETNEALEQFGRRHRAGLRQDSRQLPARDRLHRPGPADAG
jgi:GAF domain-containing protein